MRVSFRFDRLIALAAIPAAVMTSACSKSETKQPPADYETPAAPAAAVPVPATFVKADFRKLGWLEGNWRGTAPNGSHFYEGYHMVNDSTMAQATYKDSTLKVKSDSAMIGFRNGRIVDEGGPVPWLATRLDSATVDFQKQNAKNHFTWTRDSMDRWTARIYNTDSNGKESVVTYPMERVKR